MIDSPRHPEIAAAKRLQRRSSRVEEGRFLVEGRQAVSELIRYGELYALYTTEDAYEKNLDILDGYEPTFISESVAEALSETVTPQGIVAIAPLITVDLGEALAKQPRLVVVLLEARDPGNAGTVIRVADAAGADAVLLVGDSVDPHNGKCVRAAAGSHFHLPIAQVQRVDDAFAALHDAGLATFATAGEAPRSLDDLVDGGDLVAPHAWVYGNEAQGLPQLAIDLADTSVSIPIYGEAESLNLATAAAVTLYASARSQRR